MQLYNISGRGLIFFLHDEMDIMETAANDLCHDIMQIYPSCRAWTCYLWDAIIVDFENACSIKPTDTVEDVVYMSALMPSEFVCQIAEKMKFMICQYIPTTIARHGYFHYSYCEYITPILDEGHEVETDTVSNTRAGRGTDGGGHKVKQGKDGSSGQSK